MVNRNILFSQSAVVTPRELALSCAAVAGFEIYVSRGRKIRYQLNSTKGMIAKALLVSVGGLGRAKAGKVVSPVDLRSKPMMQRAGHSIVNCPLSFDPWA